LPSRWRSRLWLQVLEGRTLPSTVTNLNDAGAGSLRQAIIDTPAGGTVDFQPGLSGTITLTSGELAINQDLTISGPGASVITVSGNNASRVFDLTSSQATVSLAGLTITQGSAQDGGGVYIAGGTATITHCVMTGNTANGSLGGDGAAGAGGGVYVASGNVSIASSMVTANQANGSQGGPGYERRCRRRRRSVCRQRKRECYQQYGHRQPGHRRRWRQRGSSHRCGRQRRRRIGRG
jgi:hypothetical protein